MPCRRVVPGYNGVDRPVRPRAPASLQLFAPPLPPPSAPDDPATAAETFCADPATSSRVPPAGEARGLQSQARGGGGAEQHGQAAPPGQGGEEIGSAGVKKRDVFRERERSTEASSRTQVITRRPLDPISGAVLLDEASSGRVRASYPGRGRDDGGGARQVWRGVAPPPARLETAPRGSELSTVVRVAHPCGDFPRRSSTATEVASWPPSACPGPVASSAGRVSCRRPRVPFPVLRSRRRGARPVALNRRIARRWL